MRVKPIILEFWHRHSTGVTCVGVIVTLTISTVVGIVSGLVHIAYTIHKHYILIKKHKMEDNKGVETPLEGVVLNKEEVDEVATKALLEWKAENITPNLKSPVLRYVHPFKKNESEQK